MFRACVPVIILGFYRVCARHLQGVTTVTMMVVAAHGLAGSALPALQREMVARGIPV